MDSGAKADLKVLRRNREKASQSCKTRRNCLLEDQVVVEDKDKKVTFRADLHEAMSIAGKVADEQSVLSQSLHHELESSASSASPGNGSASLTITRDSTSF